MRDVWLRLRELGCYSIARAVYDVTFSEMGRPHVHTMAVVGAAHGAELIIKARIAEEHPMLIFTQLPKSRRPDDQLSLDVLFDEGRTYSYAQLPEILWAIRQERIPAPEQYAAFGRLRNGMVHFGAPPERDLAVEVLRFAFLVVEPILKAFWDASIVPFAEEYDEIIHNEGYLNEQLERAGVDPIGDPPPTLS